MRTAQFSWTPTAGWSSPLEGAASAQLVLTFGPSGDAAAAGRDAALAAAFPTAVHVFCSSGGQIRGTEVVDAESVVTALTFEGTGVRGASCQHAAGEDSTLVGQRIATLLPRKGLSHVLVFSDGLRVNGSGLVRGIAAVMGPEITISGGLAADADRFVTTPVGLGVGAPAVAAPGTIAAVGLYGDKVQVHAAARDGWDLFGPERLVTRSDGNVLHELDGEPALTLYKRYLGPFADQLPASALLFPLSLRARREDGEHGAVVRTVLAVDEVTGTMTFAGDVPQGSHVRLMRSTLDRLIGGAQEAAEVAGKDAADPRFALVVSCIGRRLVLRQRVEEELEAVTAALPHLTLTGFYSYGEIAPGATCEASELHNQTMTLTLIGEAA